MGQYIQDGPRAMMETVVRFKRSHNSYAVPFEEADADGLNFPGGGGAIGDYGGGGGGVSGLMACAISGYMSGVNPFNQPGVEAYKKNMFRMLGKPGC